MTAFENGPSNNRWERWLLGGLLLGLFAVKLLPIVGLASDEDHAGHGALESLFHWTLPIMGVLEALLGWLLFTRWWRLGATASIVLWAAVTGLVVAAMVLRVPLDGCGCLGPLVMSDLGRVSIVVGLLLLSVRIASAAEIAEGPSAPAPVVLDTP